MVRVGRLWGKMLGALWTLDGNLAIFLKGCSEEGDLEATQLISGRAVYSLWFICL